MLYRRLTIALALLVTVLPAKAVTLVIGSFPPPLVLVAIGNFGGTVDTVNFNVPLANLGDGTPIAGTPAIRVLVAARAAPANSRLATLTADSSTPLSNGANTIAFSTISWTASDNDIPSATFNDGVQTLTSFLNSRILLNFHTFQYANSQVLAAGTYTGRVTYTVTMP